MSRPNRRLRRELRKIRDDGFIFRGRYFHVCIGESKEYQVVISVRKKFGKSISRNRVRRQIRAICRDLVGSMDCPSRLMLISVGDHSDSATYREMREDLTAAFHSLGVTIP